MKKHILFLLIMATMIIVSCHTHNPYKSTSSRGDIDSIVKSGELVAVTLESAISYYTYGDDERGFDYSLAQNLADYLELPLKMVIVNTIDELTEMLERGEADIAIYKTSPTKAIRNRFLVSSVQTMSHVVLIQRSDKKGKVKNLMDLIDKSVYVQQNTRYNAQIKHINNEIGGGINIKYLPDTLRQEDIIYMVSQGEIDYTIADDDIANLSKKYLKNIDVSMPISIDLPKAWLVRQDAPKLDSLINEWYSEVENSKYLRQITYKYLSNSRYFDSFQTEEEKSNAYLYSKLDYKNYNGHISPYDTLFIKAEKLTGLDWRLLAAVALHESRYNPNAISPNGAMGVMQLMRRTGKNFGLTDSTFFVPSENIKAGAKLLASLEKNLMFIKDKNERIKAMLASYNAGYGHVLDAINLAKKHDGSAQSWDKNISKYMLKKSDPAYYKDEVVKLGYFRANHTVRFVNSVMITYEGFKQK